MSDRLIKIGDVFRAPGLSTCSLCKDEYFNIANDFVETPVQCLIPKEPSDQDTITANFPLDQEFIAVEAYKTPAHKDSYGDDWTEAWTVICVPRSDGNIRIKFYQTGVFKYTLTNIKFLQ